MNDVIIVGGGPAGALAAAILARAGARVRIFERAQFPRRKLCGDTLNPGAMRLLAEHVPIQPILTRGLALDGMIVTGPGAEVRGRYGEGLLGRSISRSELDVMMVEHAVSVGAAFDDEVSVAAPRADANGQVCGVTLRTSGGMMRAHDASMVIAADGRESRLARAFGLARHPRRPRRWAIGAYFEGVDELVNAGEMHVRRGHYIGVAPLPDGLANACLVVQHRAGRAWRDPATALLSAIRADERLRSRFARARMIDQPNVLGPMAVDTTSVGVPGMLLAGDAAGFIDPMTGDGLRLALCGATLAAAVTLDVLAGRIDAAGAVDRLARKRRQSFARKWRFNRSLRALVSSASAVSAAATGARMLPTVFEAAIRYAGDCGAELSAFTLSTHGVKNA